MVPCHAVPADGVVGVLCLNKGTASYWRLPGGPEDDVAWSHQSPVPPSTEIAGYVSFYDKLVDVVEL
ncbi:DUF427 domain-containing protein [Arthrobacter sp.]|uniref:DUF427 domain-containing protein n=1 Tax=Arthrobacter sp. TaxID=1667 RepID=UPI0026DEDDD8|nr:DUF427 domain-containing protein [Arthrobacter sp.]MDO5752980.1 DUF427 domain-containing protein [Arthrobacter sp.]